MLYKLIKSEDKFTDIEPIGFEDFSHHGHLEEDLENLLANNLLGVLFEDNRLMPIFQERKRQEEADIYALNEKGDLIIFELKRGGAGSGAVHQALRYCEKSAYWNYDKLQEMLDKYRVKNGEPKEDLREAHKANFDLDSPLDRTMFNRSQHLMVVGSAANSELIRTVDYWKSQGISLDFVPYRVYEINKEHYFEFFSIPYDKHTNPKDIKGVLFDTNKSYNSDSIWYMLENDRVAAFGGVKHVVKYLKEKDVVFFYHKGFGIVAAGTVTSSVKTDGKDTLYRDIKFITSKPSKDNIQKYSVSASEIKSTLSRNFFWAKTIKTPYISTNEIKALLKVLKAKHSKV
jgi:hypothetical protein